MMSTLFTVGPYMDMLLDGMFHPTEVLDDGTVVWENPAGKPSLTLSQNAYRETRG